MPNLLPLFLNVDRRTVVLVGGGRVAAAKLPALLAAGARVRVVAPDLCAELVRQAAPPAPVELVPRGVVPGDLDDAWLVVAAATPEVNREVAAAAELRRLFVNAVDDPRNASAYLTGVVRRDGVTLAISTEGAAPALTSLLREALDAVLPRELAAWVEVARVERPAWRRGNVPMRARKPRLLDALNDLYESAEPRPDRDAPIVPWLSGPEDSWR